MVFKCLDHDKKFGSTIDRSTMVPSIVELMLLDEWTKRKFTNLIFCFEIL